MDCLPSVADKDRQCTVAKLLEKSAGCFLWVSLVLQELRQVHTSAEISRVLEDVPSNMDELYSRILDSMSRAPYGKVLAKAILTWTVCSARPLTTEELYHALQLDIKDSIDEIEKSITACCGQLVYIDAKSRVHIVHQTARVFLLRPTNTSKFAIERKSGHKRLATTCLQYLCGNEMKGPRYRKLSVNSVVRTCCAFVGYACSALYEHIGHVSSTDDDVFLALMKFLNSLNILSWIEYLAQIPDLSCIIQTGRSLGHYLQRQSKSVSPFGKDVATLDSWATDLVRLVAKFGKNPAAFPASIFHLIPPFCPPDSALRKQFAASAREIAVLGLSTTAWDDCLSTIVHPDEQLTALACCDMYFAIGLSTGKVVVYHEISCQEARTLQHEEPVRRLQFGQTGNVMASAGMKSIRLWDVVSWQQLWQLDTLHDCLSLCFTDEDKLLLGALRNNQLMIWDLTTGLLRDSADWTEDYDGHSAHASRRPITAAICIELSLLAVVYRGQDILIWDIEANALHETYGKETGAHLDPALSRSTKAFVTGGLVFSSDPGATLLAASYSDGDLVLFDTYEGTVKERTLAYAQTLASSPNGRTLASADSTGTIQLFDFETLKLIYRIRSEEHSIKSLAFSGDNCRLLDIRVSECRVWDPTVLLLQDVDDENSDTVSVSTAPQEIRLESSEDVVLITSLALHGSGEVFFCGKTDGAIYLYETKTGSEVQRLVSHAIGVSIVSLFYNNYSSILSSADSSSRVMCHKLVPQQGAWKAVKVSFDRRVGVAIDQVLSNREGTRLLVCSASKDVLYPISLTEIFPPTSINWVEHQPQRRANHPSNHDQLIFMTNERVHFYEWKTLQRLTAVDGIVLECQMLLQLSIRSLTSCADGRRVAAAFGESSGSHAKSTKLLLWSTSDFSMQSHLAVAVPLYQVLADQVQFVIGAYGQRLVFLRSNGWICSIDLGIRNIGQYVRHFFIPVDWMSAGVELMVGVTYNGDIVFVKRHEVAVIKRGLDISEQGQNTPGQRPSMTILKEPLLKPTKSQRSEEMFLRPLPYEKHSSLPVRKTEGSEG